MASHNAHETRRGSGSQGAGPARGSTTQADAGDPRNGVASVGRGLDEETGGDTISGFEEEEE